MTKRKTRRQITKAKDTSTFETKTYTHQTASVYKPPKFIPVKINPENELRNKDFIDVIGSVRTYADLFKDKTLINHTVHESTTVKPKTGDFVRFKDLVENKRFNGKIGLVKKDLGESRFKVATINDAEDFSVSFANFDIIKNMMIISKSNLSNKLYCIR